jgi:sortase A
MSTTQKIVLFVIAIAAGVFTITLVHAVWYAPDIEVSDAAAGVGTSTPAELAANSTDFPSRLMIPQLNIDANVQHVGIAKSGAMAVPSNFTDAAWYKYGALPGQAGTAVMDGHVDNGLSLAGVFKQLDSIQTGNDIYVVTNDGQKFHYVVSDIELYPYTDVPMNQIITKTGPPKLALITCDGAWVQGQKTYDHRLVVYATLVS